MFFFKKSIKIRRKFEIDLLHDVTIQAMITQFSILLRPLLFLHLKILKNQNFKKKNLKVTETTLSDVIFARKSNSQNSDQ